MPKEIGVDLPILSNAHKADKVCDHIRKQIDGSTSMILRFQQTGEDQEPGCSKREE